MPEDWTDPTEDDTPGVLEIWPENWHAVRVFNGLATQWRRDGDHIAGLLYPSIGVVAEGMGVALRDVFAPLQLMEEAALAVYRRKGH